MCNVIDFLHALPCRLALQQKRNPAWLSSQLVLLHIHLATSHCQFLIHAATSESKASATTPGILQHKLVGGTSMPLTALHCAAVRLVNAGLGPVPGLLPAQGHSALGRCCKRRLAPVRPSGPAHQAGRNSSGVSCEYVMHASPSTWYLPSIIVSTNWPKCSLGLMAGSLGVMEIGVYPTYFSVLKVVLFLARHRRELNST